MRYHSYDLLRTSLEPATTVYTTLGDGCLSESPSSSLGRVFGKDGGEIELWKIAGER